MEDLESMEDQIRFNDEDMGSSKEDLGSTKEDLLKKDLGMQKLGIKRLTFSRSKA